MSTHHAEPGAGPDRGLPDLDAVRTRIAKAWDVVGRDGRPDGGRDGLGEDDGAWLREVRDALPTLQELRAAIPDLRHAGAPLADAGRRVRKAVGPHLERLTWRRALLAAVALLALVAVAIPVTGHSEEAIAWAGERVFGVPPLPADVGVPDERSRVLDADGNVLATLTGPENRRIVPLEEIPPILRQAVIATEDARFWRHDGIDTRGIIRAAVANSREGGIAQGGSTITQQYVKNVLLTKERSFRRKVTEATWAVRLEQRLDKNQILEGYLNVVYLGGGTYGVGAASEFWFGMPVQEIDLSRAALLASMISAPSRARLQEDPAAAEPGRRAVLDEMVGLGIVSRAEADAAAATPVADLIDITPLPEPEQPMFVRHVVDMLLASDALGRTREERANEIFGGGLTITTTLDRRLQDAAATTLAEYLTDPVADPLGGIVSVVPGDGAIRAMALGPKGWGPCDDVPEGEPCTTTAVNPLVSGAGSPGRQVGSSFKPILVAAALEQGIRTDWHTSTTGGKAIEGCPEDWEPENYSGGSSGTIDAVDALRTSNNVFHVKLGVAVGLENVAEMGHRLGLGDLPAYCSLPLGSIESHPVTMAAAYATFAAGGRWCEPYAVAEVRDRKGELVLAGSPHCEDVLSPEVAATVSELLELNMRSGTATRAQIGRPAAAKTGTTNDYRDAWLVGYTPQLATAVWLGYAVPTEMRGILGYRVIAGGTVPARIWGAYMARAVEPWDVVGLPDATLERWNHSCRGDQDSFEDGMQRCSEPSRKDKRGGRGGRSRGKD